MTQTLNKEIAYEALQNFFTNKPFVLLGTGPSIAVDKGFGMPSLKDFLCQEIPKNPLTDIQISEWELLKNSLHKNNNDFESAMDEIKDKDLIQLVIRLTSKELGKLNNEFYVKILLGEKNWPPLPLFKRLIEGLPETDRILHAATTNYDLLAEAAFEKEKLPYITGFYGGVCRHQDWEQARQSMTFIDTVHNPRSKKIKKAVKIRKHIRFYKVHGSLNTFMFNNEIVENNYWIEKCLADKDIKRVMITPGGHKYQDLHEFRSTLLSEYDEAKEKHNAFLFIGFGFNDSQLINQDFKNKLKNKKCPVLILTRGSNKKIDEIWQENENTWLVCKPPDRDDNWAQICNSRYSKPYFDDEPLWDSSRFAAKILGG
jgi:hypothetical protein